MNPISSISGPGRGEPARDAGAVPTDLAGMFAAIFAATTAAPLTPPPVPVVPVALPEGGVTSEAKPCAEGGMPSVAEGVKPTALPNGTPALPALAAPGRARHDRTGLPVGGVVPTLGHGFASANTSDAATAAVDTARLAAGANGADAGRLALPVDAMPPQSAADATLARMIATANATAQTSVGSTATAATPAVVVTTASSGATPRLDVRASAASGTPRSDVAARDLATTVAQEGLRAVVTRTEDRSGDATRQGMPGKGKGRATGRAESGNHEAAAATFAPVEGAVPTPVVDKPVPVSPHAALVGMTPHAPRIETPTPQLAAVAGPAPLPEDKPQTATPTHATIAFATPDGGEGRLRVSMRGDTLRATLQLPDATAAERIEQDLGGLSRALRAQGFEEARITVDVARTAHAERGHDEPSPREQRQSREQQSHANERQPRRERGASREER